MRFLGFSQFSLSNLTKQSKKSPNSQDSFRLEKKLAVVVFTSPGWLSPSPILVTLQIEASVCWRVRLFLAKSLPFFSSERAHLPPKFSTGIRSKKTPYRRKRGRTSAKSSIVFVMDLTRVRDSEWWLRRGEGTIEHPSSSGYIIRTTRKYWLCVLDIITSSISSFIPSLMFCSLLTEGGRLNAISRTGLCLV